MTRGRARRYLLTKQGYYPGVVASMGYDVWDWSTLNAGTLFQDSAKTTPASANGDVIGCWTDGVGGVDATQVTTANKPGLATASLNGLPTLSFDGSDLLATANISMSTFVVWIVAKITNINSMLYEQSIQSVNNPGMAIFNDGADKLQIVVRRGAIVNAKTNTATTLNDFALYRHDNNGTAATHTLTINNVLQTLGVDVDDVGTGTATDALYIGARSGVVAPIIGDIGQLLITSPYPTDASILVNMSSYINNLWNGVY